MSVTQIWCERRKAKKGLDGGGEGLKRGGGEDRGGGGAKDAGGGVGGGSGDGGL